MKNKKIGDIWTKIKGLQHGLDVQNIFNLVLKEIYNIYKTKSLTKKQIKKYKMTKRKFFKKFKNLSENKLNARNNEEVYAKNDVMTTVIKPCRGGKKRSKRKMDAFRRKIMTPDSEIQNVQNTNSNQK